MVEQKKKNCNIARYMVLDKLETNDNREKPHTNTLQNAKGDKRDRQKERSIQKNRGRSDIVGLSGFSNHHSCFFEGPSALPLDPRDAPLIVD